MFLFYRRRRFCTVASLILNISPIPEEGLEIPILMHFVHENNKILEKMKIFVAKQVEKMKEKFDVKVLMGERECLEEEEL